MYEAEEVQQELPTQEPIIVQTETQEETEKVVSMNEL